MSDLTKFGFAALVIFGVSSIVFHAYGIAGASFFGLILFGFHVRNGAEKKLVSVSQAVIVLSIVTVLGKWTLGA